MAPKRKQLAGKSQSPAEVYKEGVNEERQPLTKRSQLADKGKQLEGDVRKDLEEQAEALETSLFLSGGATTDEANDSFPVDVTSELSCWSSCEWAGCNALRRRPIHLYVHCVIKHVEIFYEGERKKCRWAECAYLATSRKEMQMHLLTHANCGPFDCPVCGDAHDGEAELKNHICEDGTASEHAFWVRMAEEETSVAGPSVARTGQRADDDAADGNGDNKTFANVEKHVKTRLRAILSQESASSESRD